MKGFPLDLSKFKKHSEDAHTATLGHPAGHKITIAKSALTPKMRSMLAEMKPEKPQVSVDPSKSKAPKVKMDGGGDVQKPQSDSSQASGSSVDSDKLSQFKSGSGMYADGGEASDGPQPGETMADYQKRQSSSSQSSQQKQNLVQGGKNAFGSNPPPDQKAKGGAVEKKSEKLDIQPAPEVDEDKKPLDIAPAEDQAPNAAPLDVSPASDQEVSTPPSGAPNSDSMPASSVTPAQGMAAPGPTGPGGPSSPPSSGGMAASVVPSQQAVAGNDQQVPDLQHGYNKEMQSIKGQADAEAAAAQAKANELNKAAALQQAQVQKFQQHFNALDQERKDAIADVKENRINPDAYWDNHSKLLAGIGIMLAGFNPSHTDGNAPAKMIQQNIQNNMNAQAQNLGSAHNILSANLHQFGNLRDAQDMTRVMMTDYVNNKIAEVAAKSVDPQVHERANQLMGQLEQHASPAFMQLAMRRSLQNGPQQQPGAASQGNHTQLRAEDPASYVQFVVPKEHQEAVAKTIGDVQAAKANENEILKQFDVAANHTMGKAVGIGLGDAASSRMNALFLPMIHDQEGRVNEYEQKTLQNLLPVVGDSNAKIAAKRQGLQDFIHNKIEKGNAIVKSASGGAMDLNQFQSTAPQQYAPKTATIGGVKYIQVAGGWKKAN